MRHLMLRLEPVIWVLFGAGMMVGSLLLPATVLVAFLATPLGIAPEGALGFERAHALAGSLLGRAVLAALIVLPLWAGAHHIRHVFIDFGGHGRDAVVGPLCYAVALVGSLLGLLAVVRL